jgi:hypothetical protein
MEVIKNDPSGPASTLAPPPEGANIHTTLSSSLIARTVATAPPVTTFDSFFTLNDKFKLYQPHFEDILTSPEDQTAFLEAVNAHKSSLPSPGELFSSLVKMQRAQIPLTKENIQKILFLYTLKNTHVYASEQRLKPPLGFFGRIGSYIKAFFTGGFRAMLGTSRIKKQYKTDLTTLAGETKRATLKYTGPIGATGLTQKTAAQIQAATGLDSGNPDSLLNLAAAESCFRRHGECIEQNPEHAQLLYLQMMVAQGKTPPAVLEFETAGIAKMHQSPIHLLDPAKILHLQEATKENRTTAPRALYVVPFVFEGYIGHIVNIVIDFNNEKVCFFDSKGKTLDQAQDSYPIALRFNLREEMTRIGETCFRNDWTPEGNVVDNGIKFQNDTHNCGRWVAYQTEAMLTTSNYEDAQKKMSEEALGNAHIETFGETAGARLLDPAFHAKLSDPQLSLTVTTA